MLQVKIVKALLFLFYIFFFVNIGYMQVMPVFHAHLSRDGNLILHLKIKKV